MCGCPMVEKYHQQGIVVLGVTKGFGAMVWKVGLNERLTC